MTEFLDASRQYRRGVVLGLSLAELFTVLVFLLLLVLGAYVLIQDETLARKDSLVNDQRDVLVTLVGGDSGTIEAALPADLQRMETREALMRMGGENRRLRDQLSAKRPDAEQIDDPGLSKDLVPAEEFKRQQDAIDALTHTTAVMRERIRQLSDPARESAIEELEAQVAELKRSHDTLLRRLDAPPNLRDALQKVDTLGAEIARLERENASLRRERQLTEDLKGQDSPCWFHPATRTNGEPYERAIYLFDILIGDEDIFVHDVPAPTPEYREQKSQLLFDRDSLNRYVTDDEFVKAFEPLKTAAENRRVRLDRRCTFYVAVWDATSETNKPRYKRAHNQVVQAIFNTYEYIHVPWPH